MGPCFKHDLPLDIKYENSEYKLILKQPYCFIEEKKAS